MQTIVLSGSIHETYAWADAQGRHRRSVRHVPNAASLQGRAFDGIVELPSFAQKRDRHAILAQLKRLQRSMPRIPYELDEDWVMPERPKKVDKALLDPKSFLLGDVGEPIHNMSLAELAQERAEIEVYFDEVETSDEPEAAEAPVTAEVTAHETFEVVQPVDVPETSEDPKPKKKGRRTNQQKAYDEALDDWENNGGSVEALRAARDALAERHPDDERLNVIPIRQTNDLDF